MNANRNLDAEKVPNIRTHVKRFVPIGVGQQGVPVVSYRGGAIPAGARTHRGDGSQSIARRGIGEVAGLEEVNPTGSQPDRSVGFSMQANRRASWGRTPCWNSRRVRGENVT